VPLLSCVGRAACAAALALVTACYSWRAQPVTPRVLCLTAHPTRIRVVHQDGTRHELRRPAVVGDVIVGNTVAGREVRIPLADIRAVETRRRDAGRTVLLMTGLAAGAAGLYVMTCELSGDCSVFGSEARAVPLR
jgi:hypothetical protein